MESHTPNTADWGHSHSCPFAKQIYSPQQTLDMDNLVASRSFSCPLTQQGCTMVHQVRGVGACGENPQNIGYEGFIIYTVYA